MDQVLHFARVLKTNEFTAFREYIQYLFLNVLYSHPVSSRVYFKGGTAIHIIYHAPRFSEDLDFTSHITGDAFSDLITDTFSHLTQSERLVFKERKTITGKRYMLATTNITDLPPVYVNLDFSFREKVLQPERSIIQTTFPILFTEFVSHLSQEEMFAEKIRAIATRKKGRDLYDLWYLSTRGVKLNENLVQQKLSYYHKDPITGMDILKRCEDFSERDFVQDLRPFVPIPERTKLPQFFSYLKAYLKQTLT
ncbi:MAG: nucleotidyl transferase AbiEii/AbiGii toxin family protein [Patescibacteria group bacterium]